MPRGGGGQGRSRRRRQPTRRRSGCYTGLQVRYPNVLGGFKPTDLRIGYHDDSFDQDTYGRESWLFMSRITAAKADAMWKTVPIGGEVRPELQTCIFTADLPTKCPWVGGRVRGGHGGEGGVEGGRQQ